MPYDIKGEDIIMLVVLGMLSVVLIVTFLSDCICTNTDIIETKEHLRNTRGSRLIRVNGGCDCRKNLMRHYEHFNDDQFDPDFGFLARHGLLPWWNSTRSTRNMSYDIRGDVPIPVPCVEGLCPFVWMKSPHIPVN